MAKQARGESLITRLWAAQMSYINDVYEVILDGLKQEYGQVRAKFEAVGGTIPETTYTFRKPREFYDVDVTIRLFIGEHNYLQGIVYAKRKSLKSNMPPDRTPDVVGRLLLKQVGEVLS